MAKSIAFAAEASRLAALLLSYIPAVCAFVAPCQPGASTAIIDRLSHSRALTALSGLGQRSAITWNSSSSFFELRLRIARAVALRKPAWVS